jgi:hypothetical protein
MKGLGVLVLLAAMAGATGCATYVALKMPGPARDREVTTGMERREVERVLGVGAASQYESAGREVVRYEYADGPPQGTKVRSVLYVGADVFSLFLSELIFWPIELYADKRIRRVGTAEYDHDDLVVSWTVMRVGGETLRQEGARGPTAGTEAPPVGASLSTSTASRPGASASAPATSSAGPPAAAAPP